MPAEAAPVPGPPRSPERPSPLAVVVGLLLLVPAAVGVVVSYVWPAAWTAAASVGLTGGDLDGPRAASGSLSDSAGVLGDALAGLTVGVAMAAAGVLGVAVVGPLLALAAHRAGRWGRWLVRLALALPLVAAAAPFALAVSWLLARDPAGPPSVAWLVGTYWVTSFGAACALGATLSLAALRRGPGQRRRWPGVLVVAGVGAAATVAVAVQDFAFSTIAFAGGPRPSTPSVLLVEYGFQRLDSGSAAVVGTVLLVLLGTLGLAATVLLVALGTRLEVDPGGPRGGQQPGAATGGRTLAGVATVAGVVAVLGVSLAGLWPWLARLGSTSLPEGVAGAETLAAAWVPPLVSTVVAVTVGSAAGVGIGALRPLGRWSELLLLPFAPWLFVGLAPLLLAHVTTARDLGLLGTFAGLVPPVWVSVPAVVAVALLARGQRLRFDALRAGGTGFGAAAGRAFVRPLLPLVAVVGGITWLVQAQDLLWPLSVAGFETPTVQTIVWQQVALGTPSDGVAVGLLLPGAVLAVAVVAVGVAQLAYLDRVAVRTGPTR